MADIAANATGRLVNGSAAGSPAEWVNWSWVGSGLSVEGQMEVLKTNADAFFLVTMGIFVFFMQAGFAFLEAGAVRWERERVQCNNT